MKKKILLIVSLFFITLFLAGCMETSETNKTNNLTLATPTPTPSGPPLFSFAAFGDNGDINNNFKEIIAQIANSDVDFVISAGDNSNGKSQKELTTFKNYLDKNLKKPYYVAIGDNDHIVNERGSRTDEAWQEVFGNPLQSFDYQNSHFVIFNSTDEKNSFTDEELNWLENDLQNSDKKFTFLIMHVPIDIPMSESFYGEASSKMTKQNEKFTRIITQNNVSQVICGHFHGYLNYEIGDIPAVVTGGAGSAPQFGFDADFHYLQINVYENSFVIKYQPID